MCPRVSIHVTQHGAGHQIYVHCKVQFYSVEWITAHSDTAIATSDLLTKDSSKVSQTPNWNKQSRYSALSLRTAVTDPPPHDAPGEVDQYAFPNFESVFLPL